MAVYFLNLKTFGRANGSGAVSAAAYRAGERIRDERTGKIHDHSDRQDVLHKQIVLPAEFTQEDMAWARDRANLWNSAEQAETRKNARTAREYLVALPVELSHARRIDLVHHFSQELSDRYGFAVDYAIHAPRDYPDSDPRNFHAHLLATTRAVTIEGLGAKTALEWRDGYRREVGLRPAVSELFHVRERWATVTNEALKDAQVDARIDHRTLRAQGIDREPYPHIPRVAFEMERNGYRSPVAERIREAYAAKLQLRAERQFDAGLGEAERSRSREAVKARQSSMEPPAKSQGLDEIRRQARETWLKMRQINADSSQSGPAERSHDDDLGR